MIKFTIIEDGLALLKWDNLDDAVELKKFIDNCKVNLQVVNVSNPFNNGVIDDK